VADSPRIEELKRRVQSDPASIAFAALAEEYRRADRFDEAIETCKAGLVRHPSYLSAHVTLGRALIEVGRLQEARAELEYVLKLAPENLAAIRGLAEIHDRIGQEDGESHTPASMPDAAPTIAVAASDATLKARSSDAAIEMPAASSDAAVPASPLVESAAGLVVSADNPASDAALAGVEAPPDLEPHVTYPSPVDPALAGLEEFLNAIIRARSERAAGR
jgi:tetratricopeptide (TPR) repeat protein